MIKLPPESRVQQRSRRQSADRRVEHLHGVCQTDHATGTMDRRGHLHQAAGVRGHQELGDRKARDVLATGADLLVTANPGCLMQVAAAVHRAGGVIGLAHTMQVLDASIRGLPAQSLLHF